VLILDTNKKMKKLLLGINTPQLRVLAVPFKINSPSEITSDSLLKRYFKDLLFI